MKKHSLKSALSGLAIAGILIGLVYLVTQAIRFFFRLLLMAMENPVEAISTAILFTLAIWAYSAIREWEAPETK